MNITYYVRRCKYKHGNDRYKKLHAANNTHTFCGKELNEKWFIENSAGLSTNDITCNTCLKYATNTFQDINNRLNIQRSSNKCQSTTQTMDSTL